jgi:hypothetical protein
MPSAAPTLSAPATSSNGSYSVSWGGVSGATSYTVQAQVDGGAWSTVQSSSSTSFTLSSQGTGTYSYRVRACNSTGCGSWSGTATVVVTYITGSIDGVDFDDAGNAAVVGWACSAGLAQSINVDLYLGGPAGSGTGIGRYVANLSSEAAVANACNVSTGSYRFSIPLSAAVRSQYTGQAIYVHGISPVGSGNPTIANSGKYQVPAPQVAGAPTLTTPASNTTGGYTVGWSAIPDATSYTLQERVDGGAWGTVQTNATQSWSASGKGNGSYGYRTQACNSSGCGPWSATDAIVVTHPPASAPTLSVPGSNSTGSYTVSWTTVSTATSYTLQEQVNSGAWTTIQTSSATSRAISGKGNGAYGYHVQACNVGGCSGWSATDSISVLRIPATPTGLAATIYATFYSDTRPPKTVYELSASWAASSGATSYDFQYCQSGGTCTTTKTTSTSIWITTIHSTAFTTNVRACNASGCSAWSPAVTPSVVNQ